MATSPREHGPNSADPRSGAVRAAPRDRGLLELIVRRPAEMARLVAGDPERWGLAGDQLYVDLKLVNSPEGRRLRLRGLNARVVLGGVIRTGDAVRKVTEEDRS